MIVENRSMSYRPDTHQLMAELLNHDAEAWASLSGLMAMLALPARRESDGVYRKVQVEVEIAPGMWQLVSSIAIEPKAIKFWYGSNGSRTEYTFVANNGGTGLAPRWRQVFESP